MERVSNIVPVAELRNKYLKIFAMAKQEPVFLAVRSRPQAVLISVEQWNTIVEELDMLWAEREAALAKLKIATGESKVEHLTEKELEAWLTEDETVPA